MKPLRLLLFAAGAIVLVVAVVAAVAFSSSFQTWAAGKALATQRGLRGSVGSVSVGISRIQAKDVRLERDGVVLVVPAIEADVPLFPVAFSKRVAVSRLVAKGWTVDLSKINAIAPASSDSVTPQTAAASAAKAFAGVFTALELPVDVAIDGLQLEGDVVLPESRGRAKVSLKGGALASGHEGKFDLVATAALADPSVNAAEMRGELLAAMDTPRTFTKLTAKLDVAARGAKFPNGVSLVADIAAARAADGETYAAAVTNQGGEILTLKAAFPRSARRLDGTWKIDVRDADVAPFALGMPLPAFTAVGEGKFDADAAFDAVHAQGRLNATADRLQVLKPELAALGELKISGEFDLAEHAGVFSVGKFEAAVTAAEPIATVRTLQAFEFNPKTGELRATDATRELLGVVLQGVPLAWAKPFLKEIEVAGSALSGELAATPRGGGVTLRSTSPLMVNGVTVAQPGKPLVRDVDVAVNVSADYTPQGWQAEIAKLTAKSGEATLFTLDAKAGQLTGKEQPLKATGRLVANVPALLSQPATRGAAVVTAGEAGIDFAASLDSKKEIEAKVALTNLATVVDKKAVSLPALSANLRVDLAPDGTIAFHVPLVVERKERKSDLTFAGTIAPEKDKMRAIDGHVTSGQLVWDDAQVLTAVVPSRPKAKSEEPETPSTDNAPPWAGVSGSIALELKRVIYSDTFEVTDLGGLVRIDAGKLKLETMQAGLGENGRARLNGTLTFDSSAAQPYALAADVIVKDFDPGPLLRALNGNQPPIVEGRFDVTSKLESRGPTLGTLVLGAGGDFQLSSKGGIFRGLPINVGNLVENTGRLANWIASAGTALKEMTGRRDEAEVANKAQALAELAKGLYPISYDQLSVTLSRDAALNTTLRDFTLIAPEVRLTGGGTLLHRPGTSLLEDSLAMEFKLRARGRQGDLLKYLGVLDAHPDDLGYATCTVPLTVGGTLGHPETKELNGRLTALALEKSGVTEKASELLNKVFGGGGK